MWSRGRLDHSKFLIKFYQYIYKRVALKWKKSGQYSIEMDVFWLKSGRSETSFKIWYVGQNGTASIETIQLKLPRGFQLELSSTEHTHTHRELFQHEDIVYI